MNLNKTICLVLNSSWQPIAVKNIRDAVSGLFTENYDAINIEYDEEGNVISMLPLNWEDWIELPLREGDYSVSSPSIKIRVPTILVSKNFSKMIRKEPKLTSANIRKRDKNTCQYTGKKLSYNEGSIDHIKPKSKGGEDSWENMVLCDRSLNTKKGNKSLKEAGLRLINEPQKPPPKSAKEEIEKIQHKDWSHFII